MTQDLLLFTFGPIQASLSAARRTQDIKTSSWIFSHFAEIAIQEAQELGCEVIFPQMPASGAASGIPNRLVILTEANQCAAIAAELKNAIEAERDKLSGLVQAYIQSTGANFNIDDWNEQMREWLEFYWVGVLWDGQDSTYGPQFRLANLGIDSRKTVRDYPTSTQRGERCTLCGVRSALSVDDAFWAKIRQRAGGRSVPQRERLCAVCATKRFSARVLKNEGLGEGFPSISSIASASFRQAVLQYWDEGTGEIVKEFLGYADKLYLPAAHIIPTPFFEADLKGTDEVIKQRFFDLEGAYLYPDSYEAQAIQEDTGAAPDKDDIKHARQLLENLSEVLNHLGASATFPHPYYAVLQVDGDHLGALLDSITSPAEHQKVSEAISRTAATMKDLVEKASPGRLIYSGGDDMLAFLPVDCALKVSREVRFAYEQNLAAEGFPNQTASAGLVIAHHKTPLQSALADVNAALAAAKDEFDRNTLVLNITKRSGVPWRMSLHWGQQTAPAPLKALIELQDLIASGKLSGKFAYELQESSSAFEQDNGYSLFKPEFYRLIKRHHDKEKWPQKADWEAFADRFMALWDYIPCIDDPSRVKELIQWMLAMRFFAQGEHS
jgi:CRISPR-associated protein Cmr2